MRKSRTKRRGKSEDQPATGAVGPGETFDPMARPEEHDSDETARHVTHPAPAPGVPISSEEYEWLKKKAKIVRKPPSKHRQEDPAGKK